jgi:tetratricopeptide (TPR) repeat protein
MRRFLSRELKRRYDELGRIQALEEEGKWAEAREWFLETRALARKAGIPHGMISWRLAVCSDNLGEPEAAMEYAVEALENDPLAVPFRNSFEIVCKRIRDTLANESWDVSNPATARFYDLLVRERETDDAAHLAMARHLLATGAPARARRILDALSVLSPRRAEAWALLAVIARGEGDEDAARAAEIEAAACDDAGGPPVFGIPGRARG